VTISACQEGNRIVIRVHDDGKGIDMERIKDVAVKAGIISRFRGKLKSIQIPGRAPKLQQTPFDLVVTDIEMPEMNGWEFIRQIKRVELKGGRVCLKDRKNERLSH